jgi:hypothetical protein
MLRLRPAVPHQRRRPRPGPQPALARPCRNCFLTTPLTPGREDYLPHVWAAWDREPRPEPVGRLNRAMPASVLAWRRLVGRGEVGPC